MAVERVFLITVLIGCIAGSPSFQLRAAARNDAGVMSPAKSASTKPAAKAALQAKDSHWTDALKNIPVGSWHLDVGGSLRYRFEHQDDFNNKRYGDPAFANDGFLLQRARVDFNLRFREDARAYVELQDARPFDLNFTKEDFVLGCPYWNYMDVRQAYAEWRRPRDAPLGLKIGRQTISYRDNRVWGPGEWGNVGRYTWDAVKFTVDAPAAEIDFIFGDRVKYDPVRFDGDYQFHAYAVYAMLKGLPFQLDLFYVKKESHGNYVISSSGETVNLDVSTFGFYVDGKWCERWDYRGTFAHTFGKREGATVEAYGANTRLGYNFDVPWKPRIGIEYSYGSGDPDPDSGRYQTFDGIFGAVDMMYGRMNLFSWMNLQDYQATLSFKPGEKMDVSLDWHFFRLDKARDAWYYGNGRPQRQDPTGVAGTGLGHEIDLVGKYKYSDHCQFQAGYGHFFPGVFIKNTGTSPGCDWVFIQVMYQL